MLGITVENNYLHGQSRGIIHGAQCEGHMIRCTGVAPQDRAGADGAGVLRDLGPQIRHVFEFFEGPANCHCSGREHRTHAVARTA